jgi:DNA polymerase III delta subunit
VDDLKPYLGEAGGVARYELTDAIDRGATSEALTTLQRMMAAGGLSAVEVLFSLHRHYSNLLALDGSLANDERDAAAILGISGFPAKKALEQSRRLGSARIATAIGLLADADSDLKGGTGLPAEVVIEILVARLARQAPRQRAGSGRR